MILSLLEGRIGVRKVQLQTVLRNMQVGSYTVNLKNPHHNALLPTPHPIPPKNGLIFNGDDYCI